MRKFFEEDETQRVLKQCRKLVARESADTEFDKTRNLYITQMIDLMTQYPEHWDKTTQLNISYFSDVFINDMNRMDFNKQYLDIIFSGLFRFLIESYISSPGEMSMESKAIRKFATNQVSYFVEDASIQINYALQDMSITMFKSLYNEEGLQAIRSFSSVKEQAKALKVVWDNEIKSKEESVNSLKEELTHQLDSYNFVGLHAGFAKLGRMKAGELFWSRLIMLIIGGLTPISIATQAYLYHHFNVAFQTPMDLIKMIPGASATLLLLYYFRVSLNNYSSVRAQIMQIELRKSLCRFIQRYSEYSAGINTKNPQLLAKFEEVIFSNIMTSEDKIPSTFDGIEQVAALISSLKSK